MNRKFPDIEGDIIQVPDSCCIGKRLPKVDAIYQATGEAKYIDDIRVDGMLFGRVLRSPYPHAKIRQIDTSRARQLTGVKAVISAADTTRIPFCHLPVTPNKMVLATDRVRFVGDEVAAVAAIDEATAQEALELIEVEYEPLPSVFDAEKALEPGAPLLYDGSGTNLASEFAREFGDVEAGLREADLVLEHRFDCPAVVSCTLEPHGCIASFDASGRLSLWTTSQNPYNIQKAVAGVLKLPLHAVRVINTFVGGAFGNKSVMLPLEPIAAFLSRKAGKPVKLMNSREEEFTTTRTRYAMVIHLRTGVKKDGSITVRTARVVTNNGAYNNKATGITLLTCNRIGNLYRVPNSRTEAQVVYTNTQYGDALRGWGGPQAHFAVESQMDIIAEALDMDPVGLRLMNANQPGDVTAWGWQITSCGLSECLREAARMSGWEEKRGKQKPRGIGIASAIHTGAGSMGTHGGGNFSEVSLKVNSDGTVNIVTGDSEIGQGSDTILCQIVSATLGVPPASIIIVSRDTDVTPVTMGTWGSRVTFIGGNAALKAAEDAKKQLFDVAARMLETRADKLDVADGNIFLRTNPEIWVPVADVAYESIVRQGKTITSRATYSPPNATPPDPKTGYGNYCATYAFGAHAAEVEVDPDTGKVTILSIVAVHDVGRAINPLLIEGQIEGGISMGIGYALTEKLMIDNGRTLNPSFASYKIVNSTEMPEVSTLLVETLDPHGPFGAKGVGEPATIPTAPAIANAVYDAIGVRIFDLPITAEKILGALRAKQERQRG
jgi:4-hydroxybenzoyl-CoA reductase alpha subunit